MQFTDDDNDFGGESMPQKDKTELTLSKRLTAKGVVSVAKDKKEEDPDEETSTVNLYGHSRYVYQVDIPTTCLIWDEAASDEVSTTAANNNNNSRKAAKDDDGKTISSFTLFEGRRRLIDITNLPLSKTGVVLFQKLVDDLKCHSHSDGHSDSNNDTLITATLSTTIPIPSSDVDNHTPRKYTAQELPQSFRTFVSCIAMELNEYIVKCDM
jgi:hypothetical protein